MLHSYIRLQEMLYHVRWSYFPTVITFAASLLAFVKFSHNLMQWVSSEGEVSLFLTLSPLFQDFIINVIISVALKRHVQVLYVFFMVTPHWFHSLEINQCILELTPSQWLFLAVQFTTHQFHSLNINDLRPTASWKAHTHSTIWNTAVCIRKMNRGNVKCW